MMIKQYITAVITFLLVSVLSGCVVDVKEDAVVADSVKAQQDIDVDSELEEQFVEAVVLMKQENYDQAISLLESFVQQESRLAAPFVNLGIAYSHRKQDKKAEEYLRQAVSIDLTHPVANNQLGLVYRRMGRFDDARKAYTNALTQYPNYLPVIKNLGILCELYLRDLPCAMSQYQHYQQLKPDDKTMKIWIADLSRRMGK